MNAPRYCSVCGTPAWWSDAANAWFHEATPRYLATRVLSVSDGRGKTINLPDIGAFPSTPAGPLHRDRNLSTPI